MDGRGGEGYQVSTRALKWVQGNWFVEGHGNGCCKNIVTVISFLPAKGLCPIFYFIGTKRILNIEIFARDSKNLINNKA